MWGYSCVDRKTEKELAEMHTSYLNTLKEKKDPKTYSPVGSYIINCKEIEDYWSGEDDLTLDIRQAKEPGIFEAKFNFGILDGVMIISADEDILERHCSQLTLEAEVDSEEEYSYEAENDKKPTTGSKRKAEAPRRLGSLPKKLKKGDAQPRTYLLKLKCRETGEGEIQTRAENGTIEFKDEDMASFTGKVDLVYTSPGTPFTGRKISDKPANFTDSWADYSEKEHDRDEVRRW